MSKRNVIPKVFNRTKEGRQLRSERMKVLGLCSLLCGGTRSQGKQTQKNWLAPIAEATGVSVLEIRRSHYPHRGFSEAHFPEFCSKIEALLDAKGDEWLAQHRLKRADFVLTILTSQESSKRHARLQKRKSVRPASSPVRTPAAVQEIIPELHAAVVHENPPVYRRSSSLRDTLERVVKRGGTAIVLLPNGSADW